MRPPWMITVPPALVVKLTASTALVKVVAPVLLMVSAPNLRTSPSVSLNHTAPEPELMLKSCVGARSDVSALFTLPPKVTSPSVVFRLVACTALGSKLALSLSSSRSSP